MKKYTVSLRTLWWGYLALLFLFVAVKFQGSFAELRERMTLPPVWPNYNLRPFATIRLQLRLLSRGWARLNLLGNTIPFVPFGYLLPLAYPRAGSFIKVLLAGLSAVLLIEAFQFCTRLGSFDVDDVLLNMLGIAAGYLLMTLVRRTSKKES